MYGKMFTSFIFFLLFTATAAEDLVEVLMSLLTKSFTTVTQKQQKNDKDEVSDSESDFRWSELANNKVSYENPRVKQEKSNHQHFIPDSLVLPQKYTIRLFNGLLLWDQSVNLFFWNQRVFLNEVESSILRTKLQQWGVALDFILSVLHLFDLIEVAFEATTSQSVIQGSRRVVRRHRDWFNMWIGC